MSGVNTYLFALTISPVQSFISQARTTRDLYAGSAILSGLMSKALSIDELKTETVILPQNKEAVSNKLVVKLSNNDPEKIGQKLEQLIQNELYRIGSKTVASFPKITINTQFFKENIQTQLCGYFQVYWVAVRLDNNYNTSYGLLERNLAAVKNLRQFKQLSQESGKKCSVCGERNGLFYNQDKIPKHIIKNAIRIQDPQLKENEILCAVCFAKRFYYNQSNDTKFPTLADIVVLNKEHKPDDAEKFLEDNPSENKLYALIKLDVDSLGKALSNLDEDGQKELSKTLGEFAESAKQIVDRYGKTVYAGGDDFLGFVNLAYLFDAINGLYDVFKSPHTELTFSTSILIAHYKAPLHKVLEYSRELLQESKERFDDKNGVGVMVMSSNSIIAKTICRYEDFKLLEGLQKSDTAKKLHFKLHTIFDYLDVMSYDEFLTQKEMIEVEIKRLMKRENGDFDKTTYGNLIKILNKQSIRLAANRYKIDLDNFIGYLKTLEQLRGAM